MLFVAVLLLISNYINSMVDSSTLRLGQDFVADSFGGDFCVYCVLYSYSGFDHPVTDTFYSTDIIITLWLFYAYGIRLVSLFSQERTWLYQYYERKLNVAHPEAFEQAQGPRDSQKSPLNILYLAEEAFLAMRASFWWEIVWLLFAGTYGLATVLETWLLSSSSPGILPESETALGFGQLVALLLLCLPCLVAIEAIGGKLSHICNF